MYRESKYIKDMSVVGLPLAGDEKLETVAALIVPPPMRAAEANARIA